MNAAENGLYFLPLGGSDEIGMNFNLYGYGPESDRKWILVDCGVTFGDLSTPGIDIIMPDSRFIEEHRDDLIAIVLTHAHEDHMGAVAHLWRRLGQPPIYATPFTAYLVRDRLAEHGLLDEAELHEIGLNSRFVLGPFDLQLVTLTHSIPEPNGLAIRTPEGLILHTGDWKLDPDPLIGAVTDSRALEALGDEGVLAMVCDSTNVFNKGESGSEGDVREEMIKLVGEQTGKVAIAAFASNVARLETAIKAAEANGRRVCLVGRSMYRMTAAAKHVGLLADCAPFVEEEEAGYFPPEKILYLCTGSQGEPRAALSRIAEGSHRNVTLGAGDTVIFSSRVIPGNERGIFDLMNRLAARGVKLVTEKDRGIHVSGHPCREELRQMYQWAKPHIAIPVHGERRHLMEHAQFAASLQIPHTLSPKNGDMIRITQNGAFVVDEAPAGRLHVDGNFITEADALSIKERRRLSFAGHVGVAMVMSDHGKLLAGPDVRAMGLPDTPDYGLDEFLDDLADVAERAFDRLSKRDKRDEEKVEEEVRLAVRREAQRIWGKKPHVEVSVLSVA
nr:ribonuclease J [Woodsholea maritima]